MPGAKAVARLDQDFRALGLAQLAYVKPVLADGRIAYSVHAADGTEIAVLADRAIACATIRQHDLEPLSVH